MRNQIYYTKPSITELELSYANDAAKNGWGSSCYDYILKFEELFRQFLGVKYAIATSSCTGALHMGLAALGISNGDEVIVGDMNWIASVSSICHLGGIPVYVDIEPDSLCLTPDSVEKAITSRTKAILAVHLYGNLCDMDSLLFLGKKYNIPVIEDSAEAIGSVYHGRRAGSLGLFGCFSFHGTKTLTTGEGGIFVTNNRKLFDKVLALSNHGRTRTQSKQFWPELVGFKYKMSNIQAAIGCAQIERIESLVKRKREIFNTYKKHLDNLPITLNPEPEGTINGYWMPTVIVEDTVRFSRDSLLNSFKSNNIDARVAFWPLSSLPMFSRVAENKVCYHLHARAFNLPSYHDITEDDINRVCKIIRQHIFNNRESFISHA